MSDVHAAIDVGTNSFHLVVARALPDGGFDVVTTEKDMVRLGSGGGDMKLLAPEAIDRGIAALARMVEVASSLGADVTAVATSAVREAENRDEFVDRAREELGLEVEVISGFEEARLIHHGVIHAVPIGDRRALVVDIGGGSTEFVISDGPELIEARSLRLGAIRLTERYLAESMAGGRAPSKAAVERCRTFLRSALDGVSRELGGHQPELGVGSSGTITAVATMIAAAAGGEPRHMNGFSFGAAELSAVVETVVTGSTSARRKIPGLEEKRVDIIVGGALLLDEIFAAFALPSMTVSEFALREGVLYDRFPTGDHHLDDLRRSNAIRLARQLDPDAEHAMTTARLATQLFDRTTALHGLGPDARELLDTAAIIHNVGIFISHSGHHKHTWYIARNSEQLTGFTEHETELVALIARYHRKSLPGDRHPEFATLTKNDKALVRTLAGLLRVAIGLDRRHQGVVTAVTARTSGRGTQLVIEPVVVGGADIEIEIFAANERTALLAQALDLEVVVRARAAD
ncbi:MAG: HD domain-containing protein [Acidimicrobiales bacterium]